MIELDEIQIENICRPDLQGNHHEIIREPLTDAWYERDYIFEQYEECLIEYDEREKALQENEQEIIEILKSRCKAIITEIYKTENSTDIMETGEWFAAHTKFSNVVQTHFNNDTNYAISELSAEIFKEALGEMV